MPICPNCGKQLPASAKFCGQCGERVEVRPKSKKSDAVSDVLANVAQGAKHMLIEDGSMLPDETFYSCHLLELILCQMSKPVPAYQLAVQTISQMVEQRDEVDLHVWFVQQLALLGLTTFRRQRREVFLGQRLGDLERVQPEMVRRFQKRAVSQRVEAVESKVLQFLWASFFDDDLAAMGVVMTYALFGEEGG